MKINKKMDAQFYSDIHFENRIMTDGKLEVAQVPRARYVDQISDAYTACASYLFFSISFFFKDFQSFSWLQIVWSPLITMSNLLAEYSVGKTQL